MKLIFLAVALAFSGAACADWQYSKDRDKMTNKETLSGSTTSVNSLVLSFPYQGKNHATLSVFEFQPTRRAVMVNVNKGQILCRNYDGCSVAIKFDDKPPIRFSASPSSDYDPKYIFVNNADRFIAAARQAKSILVQVSMYQEGAQVLEFKSAKPLEWNTTSPKQPNKQRSPSCDRRCQLLLPTQSHQP